MENTAIIRTGILAATITLLAMPLAAYGQTQQWSSPTRTEQWSMPDAAAPVTGSTVPLTVQPGGSQQPATTAASGLPHGMAGTWNIWISSGIVHRTDGLRTEQVLIPGAAMNLLQIAPDGSYQWGNQRGRLQEIAPWFAQPGQRYFAVRQNADNQYIARFDAHTDKLNLFFWDVGGLAASGTRK